MPYLCAMLIKRPGGFPEPNKFQIWEQRKEHRRRTLPRLQPSLDGKVKFSSIIYSQQMLSEKYRETGVNDMYFIGKKFGLWFYTSRAALDNLCYLQNPKFPTWVLCENSLSLYEIR